MPQLLLSQGPQKYPVCCQLQRTDPFITVIADHYHHKPTEISAGTSLLAFAARFLTVCLDLMLQRSIISDFSAQHPAWRDIDEEILEKTAIQGVRLVSFEALSVLRTEDVHDIQLSIQKI